MERVGYCRKYGYIYDKQDKEGKLVWIKGVGWVKKPA
jgi:hypothetical protein